MPRIGFIVVTLVFFAGCQAPPLGMGGATRVPPPPTGTVGNSYGNGYYEPAPRPDLGQGAAHWPASNFVPPADSTLPPSTPSYNRTADANARPALQPDDRLDWIDPTASAPGLTATNGPSQPLVSTPPRVRGFQNVRDRRDLYVPQELADYRNQNLPTSGVRQASGYSNWQPRYDDVRR